MSKGHLRIDIRTKIGSLELDVSHVTSAGITAIVGPSGAGKTSLLRLVAGLKKGAEGSITLGDIVFQDSTRNIFLKPEARHVGYIFQEPHLFAHMSVGRNVDYGARRRGRVDARERSDIITLLDIAPLMERMPHRLSGGEAQRVSIARALMSSPRLLLMDEPLSSLDTKRRREIMPYLEKLPERLKIPVLYVSHNLDEVMRIAENVIIMDRGHIFHSGPMAQTLNRPDVQQLLAGAEGIEADRGTIIEAHILKHEPDIMISHLTFGDGLRLRLPLLIGAPGSSIRLRLHARDIAIARSEPRDISIRNVLPGKIMDIQPTPDGQREVHISIDGGRGSVIISRITQDASRELGLSPGLPIWALIKSVALTSG